MIDRLGGSIAQAEALADALAERLRGAGAAELMAVAQRMTLVLNTRPAEQAAELSALLRQAGFEVLEVPAIGVEPVPYVLAEGSYAWLVLQSQNAARYFPARPSTRSCAELPRRVRAESVPTSFSNASRPRRPSMLCMRSFSLATASWSLAPRTGATSWWTVCGRSG